MASIADVIATLERARAKIEHGLQMVDNALEHWESGTATLREMLAGSGAPDAHQVLAQCVTARTKAIEARQAATRSHETAQAIITRLRGGNPVAHAAAPQSTTPPQPKPDSVQASDGSRYPVAAAWGVDLLPRRVVRGYNERTVGYVDGIPGPFVSGRDQAWTPAIEQRMAELGLSQYLARLLRSHVELKVATMMLMARRPTCVLLINHAPCGSEAGDPPGCDQTVERYLPVGYTLTVHGTTMDGSPFSRTYEGQA
jgi:hypothetical protein